MAGAVLAVGVGSVVAAVVEGGPPEPASPMAAPAAAAAPLWQDLSTGSLYVDLWFQMQKSADGSFFGASPQASGLAGLSLPHQHGKPVFDSVTETETAPSPGDLPLMHSTAPISEGDDDLPTSTAAHDPADRYRWGTLLGRNDRASGGHAEGGESRFNAPAADPGSLRLTREAIDWLRQHRWQVLGALAGLGVLAGLLKAYSRRPSH